jgi:hypothetical protein
MEKKSFMFYTSWNEAIKKMDEQQLRSFITNLCNYAEGNSVTLDGLVDEIMWSQVKPLLDYNETKRQKRIESGKKGGLAKASILSNAKQNLVDYSIPTEEGRGMKEEGRRLKVEGREKKEEGKKVESKKGVIIDDNGMFIDFDNTITLSEFDRNQIKDKLYSMNLGSELLTAMLTMIEPEGYLTKKQRELIEEEKYKFNKIGVLQPILNSF